VAVPSVEPEADTVIFQTGHVRKSWRRNFHNGVQGQKPSRESEGLHLKQNVNLLNRFQR